jgi:hypothetical protein
MKIVGLLLVIGGIAVAIFVAYLFFEDNGRVLSPIPQEDRVKVIFVTPTRGPEPR